MVIYGITHKRVATRTELHKVAITNSKKYKKRCRYARVSVCAYV